VKSRIEVIRRRDEFERNPEAFVKKWSRKDAALRRQIVKARDALGDIDVPDEVLEKASELCLALGTDGLRGELTIIRTSRAAAALAGDKTVTLKHLKSTAAPALRHRLRRNPLDDAGSGVRVDRAMAEVLG